MKIAITSHGANPQANVDSRLNQSKYFMLYDKEADTWECLTHTGKESVAQSLENSGATILITGYVGHKALKSLQAKQIKTYSCGDANTRVEAILSDFLTDKLIALAAPNALDIVSEAKRNARFI